jgi:hypothetical protein
MKACETAQKHAKARKTSQNSAKIRKSIKVFKCLVLPFQFFWFAVQKSVAHFERGEGVCVKDILWTAYCCQKYCKI